MCRTFNSEVDLKRFGQRLVTVTVIIVLKRIASSNMDDVPLLYLEVAAVRTFLECKDIMMLALLPLFKASLCWNTKLENMLFCVGRCW